MSERITKKIEKQSGHDIVKTLSESVSGSELNSLLLEVFAKRLQSVTPPELLKLYSANRFVQPAETDMINLLEKSLATLKIFKHHGFEPLHVSPLSQLGTCSVVAPCDQDKIVTTLRNCEVLSDASNAIALHISHLKKNADHFVTDQHLKFGTVQRHVRAQPITVKGFSPHFTIGCLVSSDKDTGNYRFERNAIVEHFRAWTDVLQHVFGVKVAYFKIQPRNGYTDGNGFVHHMVDHVKNEIPDASVKIDDASKENNYYKGVQFKVVIVVKGQEFEIADGGFVDWTQQLLNNRKERLMISGFGLELMNKFEEGLI